MMMMMIKMIMMTHQGLPSLQALSLLSGRDSRGSVQRRVSVQETRDGGKVRPVQGGLLCSHRRQPRGNDDDDDDDDEEEEEKEEDVDDVYDNDVLHPEGCTECFCYGVTTACESASLGVEVLDHESGWTVTDIR